MFVLQREDVYFTRGPQTALLCDLTPFTEYTIRVCVRAWSAGARTDVHLADEFTSQWVYITERTQPAGKGKQSL